MRFIKQSTSVDLVIGPFLDQTDGFTAETALTITQPDIRLKKNGGAWAQKAAAQTLSHEENGNYEVTLDATDTDTLGQLRVHIHESGALPVWEDFGVMPANVWDAFFGADKLQVHADEITAGLITAAAIAADAITDAKVASDVTIASVTGAVGSVTGAVGSVTGLTAADVGAIKAKTDNLPTDPADQSLIIAATDALVTAVGTRASQASVDVVDGIVDDILLDTAEIGAAGAGLTNIDLPNQTMNITGNLTGNVSGSVGSVTGAVGSVTAGVTLAASAVQAIWDALTSALTTVGSIGKLLVDNINATISSRLASASYTAPPTVGQIADQVWEEDLTDHSGTAGSTAEALGAAGSAGDPWTTALPGAYSSGQAGKIVGDNLNTTVSSRSSHSAADVWAVGARTLTAFDASFKTGYALSAAGVQAIWDALTSALTTVGSIGKLLVDNVNATISSRSSHSAADVWTAGTRTLTSFGTLAADVWASVARTLTAATNITSTGGTTVPQTGDSFARLGVPAGASVSADLAAIEAQTDDIGAAGAGLTALATAANLTTVDTVVDSILALLVDARVEPGQGAPAATEDPLTKLDYLYKLARNRITQDATTLKVYADDAVTVDHKATVSDSGTVYDRGELGTGP